MNDHSKHALAAPAGANSPASNVRTAAMRAFACAADETIINFLQQAPSHLNKHGKILLLLSSMTPRKRINKILKNYKHKKIADEKLFFETLEVFELC
jgi:hypothetical protein